MTNNYLDILKKYWGYDRFRGIQLDIIESIGDGHDTLGLMPTGGGKSVLFQGPSIYRAIFTHRLSLVVSPLRALMQDQVSALKAAGVEAVFLNSTLTSEQYGSALLSSCIMLLLFALEQVSVNYCSACWPFL